MSIIEQSYEQTEVLGSFGELAEMLGDTLSCSDVRGLDDDVLLAVTGVIEQVGRRIDALRVATAGELAERSRPVLGTERLSAKRGCRTPSELIQRVTQVSAMTAERRMRLGGHLRTDYTLTGMPFPPKFPLIAEALVTGQIGVDAASTIVNALTPALRRVDLDIIHKAETALVAAALGQGAECSVPATADELHLQAQVWKAWIDPDGVKPDEDQALLKRAFRLGRERDGVIPFSGALMPEIGGKLGRLFDAFMSPKTAPVCFRAEEDADSPSEVADSPEAPPVEIRTPDQVRHDVLAAIFDIAARSTETPSIGGAAPTVLVSVQQADLDQNKGVGYIDGVDTPVSLQTVKQMICTGGTQQVVLNDEGRILRLGVPDRCFTGWQRRAIILRDGGCIIPGCRIPAAWCEIHHVVPDVQGGPTHTDNGVLTCWFHHRTIDTSGWQIRMTRGAPQIKAPLWIDPTATWRTATKSPTRLANGYGTLIWPHL